MRMHPEMREGDPAYVNRSGTQVPDACWRAGRVGVPYAPLNTNPAHIVGAAKRYAFS